MRGLLVKLDEIGSDFVHLYVLKGYYINFFKGEELRRYQSLLYREPAKYRLLFLGCVCLEASV